MQSDQRCILRPQHVVLLRKFRKLQPFMGVSFLRQMSSPGKTSTAGFYPLPHLYQNLRTRHLEIPIHYLRAVFVFLIASILVDTMYSRAESCAFFFNKRFYFQHMHESGIHLVIKRSG